MRYKDNAPTQHYSESSKLNERIYKNTKNLVGGFVLGYGSSKLSNKLGNEYIGVGVSLVGNCVGFASRRIFNKTKNNISFSEAILKTPERDITMILGTLIGYGISELEDAVLPLFT